MDSIYGLLSCVSLKMNVPPSPVDGLRAPRCEQSTDEGEFAETSDDDFIASDNEADPKKLSKEVFVKIKNLEMEITELRQHLERKLAEIQHGLSGKD